MAHDCAVFARVIFDVATFAYLVDVFVLQRHRGLGYGRAIKDAVITYSPLPGVRRLMLATSRTHAHHARFDSASPAKPASLMDTHGAAICRVTP